MLQWHEMLSFMDGFSGYNQIKMDKDDTSKVSFNTDFGVFCYLVMAFGLKNVGATYQRVFNKIFKYLIVNTMEIYVDDILVKSLDKADHISHLQEAFEVLRHHKMMLNPTLYKRLKPTTRCIPGPTTYHKSAHKR